MCVVLDRTCKEERNNRKSIPSIITIGKNLLLYQIQGQVVCYHFAFLGKELPQNKYLLDCKWDCAFSYCYASQLYFLQYSTFVSRPVTPSPTFHVGSQSWHAESWNPSLSKQSYSGMWDLSSPTRDLTLSPALEGKFLITGPSEKSLYF